MSHEHVHPIFRGILDVIQRPQPSPHRILAETHKHLKPHDPRSVEVLETYYSNLSHGSPIARTFSDIAARDRAVESAQLAETTVDAALSRASVDSGMLAYAQEIAALWAHLGRDELIEQIEAHLESNFPDADIELIECIADRVVR